MRYTPHSLPAMSEDQAGNLLDIDADAGVNAVELSNRDPAKTTALHESPPIASMTPRTTHE
jgi:hypothetical protein